MLVVVLNMIATYQYIFLVGKLDDGRRHCLT